MDEILLVRASQAGDRVAFGSLTDQYYKSIYRFAFRYMGHHHDADEVCQETFLRAFVNIRKLRDGNCFKAWIFMIASNLLRKRVRMSKREKTLDLEKQDSTVVELAEEGKAGPLKTMLAKEKAIIIHEQLQKMPEHMRLVTILIFVEGLSQKDTAGILNYSEPSVSRYLDMAKKWLKSRLQNLI